MLGVEEDADVPDGSEDSDTENALVDPRITFDKKMSGHIACLMDLSPTLECMANDSNLAGADPVVGPNSNTFHVTESAKRFVIQVQSAFAPVSKFHDSGLGTSMASHSSFVSTEAESSLGRLRVPPTPDAVGNGLSFDCFVCGQRQAKIKNRVDWK